MLILVSFFFLISGSMGKSFICRVDPHDLCLPTGGFSQRLPTNGTELLEVCSKLSTFMRCETAVMEMCEGENEGLLKDKAYIKLLALVCNEESPLFKGIVENLHCLAHVKGNYDTELCQDIAHYSLHESLEETDPELFSEMHLAFDNEEFTKDSSQLLVCLGYIDEVACMIENGARHCGADFKDIALEIIPYSDYAIDICPSYLARVLKNLESFPPDKSEKITKEDKFEEDNNNTEEEDN